MASLGSAHSVNDTEPDWIPREIELLRDAVRAEVPVLGLCWGGQALSVAMGGQVGPAAAPETGWLTVPSADPELPEGPWLHYHYESFTVPAGAIELARSPSRTAGLSRPAPSRAAVPSRGDGDDGRDLGPHGPPPITG